VLGPFIFRRTVHLDPLITLLGVLFLAELLGIAGALVAVPAVALAQIVLRELLAVRRERLSAEVAASGATGTAPAMHPPAEEREPSSARPTVRGERPSSR